jgi:hypothetical protein
LLSLSTHTIHSFIHSFIHSTLFFRKTVTAIVTAGTAFHLVFQVDYGNHDHVFTELQRWYRKKVDDILIGDIGQPTRTIREEDDKLSKVKNMSQQNNMIPSSNTRTNLNDVR